MRRARLLVVGVAAATSLAACRDHTVDIEFAPRRGDQFDYRYTVRATLTREVDGGEPEVQTVDTVLLAHQEVLGRRGRGTRIEIDLTRDGGARSTVVAIVDRAGSLEGIELVQGLDAEVFGIGGAGGFVTDPVDGLPDRPIRPGHRWSISDGTRRGTGELVRLGVEDGRDVAVVRTSTDEPLEIEGGDGRIRAGSRTSYDLVDGAVRSSRSWSHGVVDAEVEPPPDVAAEPVQARIRYDVEVEVERR
jgi:hypothetical protein